MSLTRKLYLFVRLLCVLSGLAALLIACQPTRDATSSAAIESNAQPEIPVNAQHFAIVSEQSRLVVLVYRAGSLARLGHNHVVSSHSITGDIYVASPLERSVFSIAIPVLDFVVDDADLRTEFGDDFSATVDADAIAGTRQNMLSAQQLDAERWSTIDIRSRSPTRVDNTWQIEIDVTTRGQQRQLQVPAQVNIADDECERQRSFQYCRQSLA